MKKIMSLVLILALVLSLGACGSKEAAPSADSGDKSPLNWSSSSGGPLRAAANSWKTW